MNTSTALPVTSSAPPPVDVSHIQQSDASLNHPKNIEYGVARVIYAQAVGRRPMGWVLPGGLRTTDYEDAFSCAVRMDALMGGAS